MIYASKQDWSEWKEEKKNLWRSIMVETASLVFLKNVPKNFLKEKAFQGQ